MSSQVPVTELAIVTLLPGIDVDKPGTEAYDAWQATLDTLSKQPGYCSSRYGIAEENPLALQVAIDWESLDAHKRFMQTEEYKPFIERLGKITESPISMFHFEPAAFPPSLLDDAPVIEAVVSYGTSPEFLQNAQEFAARMKDQPIEGWHGADVAPIVEEIARDDDAEKEPAVFLYIGWDSKEIHLKFRETDHFKSIIHLLRTGVKGVSMKHIAFKPGKAPA